MKVASCIWSSGQYFYKPLFWQSGIRQGLDTLPRPARLVLLQPLRDVPCPVGAVVGALSCTGTRAWFPLALSWVPLLILQGRIKILECTQVLGSTASTCWRFYRGSEVLLTFWRCSHMRSGPSSTSSSSVHGGLWMLQVLRETLSSGRFSTSPSFLAASRQTTVAFGRTSHIFSGGKFWAHAEWKKCAQSMLQLPYLSALCALENWTLLSRAARTLQSLVRCLGVACEFSARSAESLGVFFGPVTATGGWGSVHRH